jgi:hypothetical protein
MAFPQTALSMGVEIYVNGAWTGIAPDVYSRDQITITRGRSDEGQAIDPAEMQLTLDNRSGNYSPRNPAGIYFGQIGRNTKIRYWVANGEPRLRFESGSGSNQFYMPDTAGISITGDIDLRSDITLPTWRPSSDSSSVATTAYLGIYKGTVNVSYRLALEPTGELTFEWTSGGGSTASKITSDQPVPGATTGRKAVRVTLDVNNGSGGKTASFYHSSDDTMSGTWILFSTITSAGTTSIFNSTESLGTVTHMNGTEINAIEIRNGIAGSVAANPIFTAQASGTTSFNDGTGNTWTRAGTGLFLDNKHYRFWGDASAWPVKWDRSGNDVYTQITCNGMTRRLGQGSTPLKSAMRRGIPAIGSDLVAYWPLEDGLDATSLAPGITGVSNGRIIGRPTLSSYSNFIASDDVPSVGTGRLYLQVPHYTNTDEFQVRFVMHVPPNTIPNNTVLMRIKTNSSLGWIDWIYQTGDIVLFETYTNLGILSLTTASFDITDQVNGQDARISLEFNKNGTGVDLKIVALPIGEDSGLTYSETNASITLGSCTSLLINPNGADLGDFAIGHVTVEKNITSVFDSAHALERAYRGEAAHYRIERLCDENDIPINLRGGGEDAEFLGYQGRGDLVTLLRESAAADGGFLIEQRDADALYYRTRESVYNQPARASIAYSDNNLQSFEPVEDDQRTRNKVTVQRDSGQSATIEDTDSVLSTNDPPDGVGIYDESATISLYSDEQAVHQACWRVRLGTVDEARYPTVEINLAHPDFATDQALTRQILSLDVGDRIEITDPPVWLPPEAIGQIVQGYHETIAQFEHTIAFNCAPAAPYRAAVYEGHPDHLARYSNENTVTNEALDTTETGINIIYSAGPDWTHADGDYDIMINGERMTVTGVSGSGGTQTFTVTRSVNGIVASHTTGANVRLFEPSYYALGASYGTGLHVDVDEGRLFRAMDYSLPDVVAEYGNGTNTITATNFAALPSFPCEATIINPHPKASMLVLVNFGAWGSASVGDWRCSIRIKRSEQEYIGTGVALGGSAGYGEIPASALTVLTHEFATFTCELEPSPVPYVFQFYAMRSDGAATVDVRYATLRLIPLRHVGL